MQIQKQSNTGRGGKRVGAGRKRGAKNRINAGVLEVVNAIFNRNDPIRVANELLNSGDPKVVFAVWKVCMEFMYGKPTERIEISGELQHTMTEVEREQSRKVLEKLLPEPIEVQGKEIN